MALIKWEPLREIEDMFDRYTKAMGWSSGRGQDLVTAGDWSPRVDVSETDNEFLIKAEIPDVKKEDVKVSVDEGILTIQGERKQEKEERGVKFHRVERYYGNFFRRFALPDNVDGTRVKASFKEGMLSLQIPKTAVSKPKALEVKVE